MKYFILLFLFTCSVAANAGNWSNKAVPTRVDIERGNGFMVYGAFGNPEQCTISDRFYITKDHPEYDKVYATILAAFMAGKKIQVYSHACQPVGWYSVPSTTYNTVAWGAVNISN